MRSNPDVGEKKLFLITSILALAECGTGLSTDAQKIITKKKVLLEVARPLCLLPTLTETFIDKKRGSPLLLFNRENSYQHFFWLIKHELTHGRLLECLSHTLRCWLVFA